MISESKQRPHRPSVRSAFPFGSAHRTRKVIARSRHTHSPGRVDRQPIRFGLSSVRRIRLPCMRLQAARRAMLLGTTRDRLDWRFQLCSRRNRRSHKSHRPRHVTEPATQNSILNKFGRLRNFFRYRQIPKDI